MSTVLLLRGVNVGGHRRVPMAELRALLTGLGAGRVETYLQSGNAVVDLPPDGLGERVEQALRDRLDVDTRVLVSTGPALDAVVAANPFPSRAATPTLLHVGFCDGPPTGVVPGRYGDDELAVGDHVLYLSYAEASYRSPLDAPLRRLDVTMTTRNWTTVLRLADLAR